MVGKGVFIVRGRVVVVTSYRIQVSSYCGFLLKANLCGQDELRWCGG